jgi:branched-chain amino acid aminotransferase
MAATVNVNGRITGAAEAVIPVFDHGFLYGEGVYETMRTYGGKPFLFDRHMHRLRRSAELMALPLPFSNEELRERIAATTSAAALPAEAYIRVLVTRGVGDLTYDLSATPTPSLVVIVKPHVPPPAEVYERGVAVVIVDIVRNHPRTVNPMIKSNNLMNSAMAMQEAYRKGAFEGVMRNYRGELTECTTANLFVVKDEVVLTPPLEAGLLPGITREFLLEIGREAGIDIRERALVDEDLILADEAFLTSTTREIVPITTVNGHPVGAGTPGPLTRRLLDAFRAATAAHA